MPYTMEDDDNLAEYLAANSLSHRGRQGKNLYEAIADVSAVPSSFRLSHLSLFLLGPSITQYARLLGMWADTANTRRHGLERLHPHAFAALHLISGFPCWYIRLPHERCKSVVL